jgi:hypothetical protein
LSEQSLGLWGQTHGESTPEAGHASHRKTNSRAQAASERRPANPRTPDGSRGRTAQRTQLGRTAGGIGTRQWSSWPIVTAFGPPSLLTSVGIKSTSLRERCMFAGSSGAHPALTRSLGMSYEPCGAFSASSSRSRPSCSLRSVEHPSAPQGLARMIERAGSEALLGFKAHPHMLRHACGYALANKGHDTRALQAYLGHRNIQHTVRYTELSPTRFRDFWRE